MSLAPESWRSRRGDIGVSVEAGQPLLLDGEGTLSYTSARPNCVALETVEIVRAGETKTIKVQMLDALPPAWAVKVCNCGHRAGEHRSSDDHCNAPGCNCPRPSCGH
jgi:hypothetical protein